ncbi:hypothetical protein HYU89_00030 [Candidatus Collierbacteria bacterium]|nr:hypothetical protein [Candidatus Collierbacteria bacterium]
MPIWFVGSLITVLLSLWTYTFISASSISSNQKVLGVGSDSALKSTLAYAAIPQAVSELKTEIKSGDSRPLIINNYLSEFQSPMTGMGEFIVAKAEELGNRLPLDATYLAFLTIAIAQNESNLGKKMPPNCFNAWGYGIHSSGTLCFQNWEEGITRFMTGVAENYIAKKGLDTPEEMMTIYTPNSPNGAWAKGVKQFMEDLNEAKK